MDLRHSRKEFIQIKQKACVACKIENSILTFANDAYFQAKASINDWDKNAVSAAVMICTLHLIFTLYISTSHVLLCIALIFG